MSLRPDDRKGRSRSKSPGGRGRDRSSSNVRASATQSYTQPGGFEMRAPTQTAPGLSSYATPSAMMSGALQDNPAQNSTFTMGDYSDLPPHERPTANSQQQWSYAANAGVGQQPQAPRGGYASSASGSNGGIQYATSATPIQYTAQPVVQPQSLPQVRHNTAPMGPPHGQGHVPYPSHSDFMPGPPGGSSAQGQLREVASRGRPHSHSLSAGGGGAELRAPSPGGLGGRMNRLSVSGNGHRPDMLSIMGQGGGGGGGGQLPPPSPLLEAYHGVYQSISPMPSPLMHAHHPNDSDIEDFESLSSRHSQGHHRTSSRYSREDSPPSKTSKSSKSSSSRSKKDKSSRDDRSDRSSRRVKIYDASEDALAIVEAMGQRIPDHDALIDILPQLNHDQMLELRQEYKRHCKVQGYGINIAKHIKMKTSGNFGKIAYVTALGRWEGEGYWANTWYQSGNARRELLIESLMGRSNVEVRSIKEAFRDKRYNDDLLRCMEKELKADKFRKAVLMTLEEKRQEEREQWPVEYRNRDVDTLYNSLRAREGGESDILQIVVTRSDNHLREVLQTYERKFGGNFARDALRKSNNLVGEVVAHILNGVINRPARDAMLLHHALDDLRDRSSSSSSNAKHERQMRYELLISRIVRLHWDRMHLIRVKAEFDKKYGMPVEHALEDSLRDDFLDFCMRLVE